MLLVQAKLKKGNRITVAWIKKEDYYKKGTKVKLKNDEEWSIEKLYSSIDSSSLTTYHHVLNLTAPLI